MFGFSAAYNLLKLMFKRKYYFRLIELLINTGSTVVTNLRHQQELVNTEHALQLVIQGIEKGITNDIVAMEIRQALHHLREITGEITTDDLLENIFSKFCIGR